MHRADISVESRANILYIEQNNISIRHLFGCGFPVAAIQRHNGQPYAGPVVLFTCSPAAASPLNHARALIFSLFFTLIFEVYLPNVEPTTEVWFTTKATLFPLSKGRWPQCIQRRYVPVPKGCYTKTKNDCCQLLLKPELHKLYWFFN